MYFSNILIFQTAGMMFTNEIDASQYEKMVINTHEGKRRLLICISVETLRLYSFSINECFSHPSFIYIENTAVSKICVENIEELGLYF